ncbi:hypothetical protein ACFX2F_033226 [Malus domestica]
MAARPCETTMTQRNPHCPLPPMRTNHSLCGSPQEPPASSSVVVSTATSQQPSTMKGVLALLSTLGGGKKGQGGA